MKRSRFSEEQIIGILKEHEAGVSVADLCRKHGVSDASIYKWKAKFGGMEVSEVKRLRALENTTSPAPYQSGSGGSPDRSSRMRARVARVVSAGRSSGANQPRLRISPRASEAQGLQAPQR